MMKRIKQLITAFALTFALLTPALAVRVAGAQADIQNSLCGGTEFTSIDQGDCAASTGGSTEGVREAINTIVDILSWIVGVVSVIMIVVGGFRYITSGGASDKVTGAKNTIIYALIGLVIVALAQFIVNFVIGTAISVDQ